MKPYETLQLAELLRFYRHFYSEIPVRNMVERTTTYY